VIVSDSFAHSSMGVATQVVRSVSVTP
jgi:hypothetical protein